LKFLGVLVSVVLTSSCSIHDSLEPLAAEYKRDSFKESYSMGETDTHSVAAGDVDGDGDIDLVFGNGQWPLRTQGADKLLLNTGDGVFGTGFWIDPRLTSGRVTECVVLADIDADGDLDLVCSYRNGPRTTPIVFENLGIGRFVEATDRFFPRGVHSTQFLAVADMDGDLDLDLVGYGSPNRQAGTPARLWVYYNEGGAYTSFRPVRCLCLLRWVRAAVSPWQIWTETLGWTSCC